MEGGQLLALLQHSFRDLFSDVNDGLVVLVAPCCFESGKQCLSYAELGSCGRKEPLPATPYMAGSGGGWIARSLVMMDRARV